MSHIGDIPSKSFNPGDVIFREGDSANGEAFLVHDGKVDIQRRVGGEERVLRTLVKGDLLGDLALFRDAPRSATAVASGAVTLLVIPASRLEAMVRTNPGLAMALIRQLASRMLEAEDRASRAEDRASRAEDRAARAEERAARAEARAAHPPAADAARDPT
jgi:CRP/FNR family transcriptional regulator